MNLAVGMLVKNEADRYLKEVVQNISQFADLLVVLDDGSTDDTVRVIQETATIPNAIHTIRDGDFGNEIVLRKALYQMVLNQNPDWFMIIDADELYAGNSKHILQLRPLFEQLMMNPNVDVWGFRLYDMWSKEAYRADPLWRAHEFHSLMLVRNIPGFQPVWRETAHHCGRFPINLWNLRTANTELLKIKHLGWAKEEDRIAKYERYMKHDPDGKYGSLEQYKSILDKEPNLVEWGN